MVEQTDADEKFHGQPEISLHKLEEENGYEVYIRGEHGLSADVKSGYDYMDGDGDPIVACDVLKEEDAEGTIEQGGSGADYAFFRLLSDDEGDE